MYMPVVFFALVQLANADTLYLNAVQSQASDTQSAMVSQNLEHDGAPVGSHAHAGCRTGNCQHGSLDDYPGGCCESDGRCCAALWANYCQDKKWCTTAGSPRRHQGGCGFPLPAWPALPHLNPFHGLSFTHCGTADCAAKVNCDQGLSSNHSQTDAAVEGALDRALEKDPSNTPNDVTPSADDPAAAGDAQGSAWTAPDPPPASALKSGLPFGIKLPFKPQSNPFKSLPTARSKPLFSR
jgi:hypothetical protein